MILELLGSFFIAAVISILAIPWITKFSYKFGVVDIPGERNVHTTPVPRLGGVAIFFSFTAVTLLAYFVDRTAIQNMILDPEKNLVILGALVAFGVGVFDDFKSMAAKHKLCFQILAALLAYAGGIRIESIGIRDIYILDLGYWAPLVSLFWIVLVMNSINLVDGLDGLAGGISFFGCMFLCYISFIGGHSLTALLMAILGGSIIGFLRYNLHPATIFMGDGGSYFLGYMLATVSVLSLADNQSTFTILIPLLALALPIIDVTMATVRRFIHGKPIFSPDKKHFHHMLLKNGYSHRNAVFFLWAIAVTISISAILLTLLPGKQSLSLLVIFILLAILFIFKLGYFKYYDKSGFIPWLKSIFDEAGISRERRSFFDLQIQINEANNLEELWCCVENALVKLEFINCTVYLNNNKLSLVRSNKITDNRRCRPAMFSTIISRKSPSDWCWVNPAMNMDEHNRSMFRIEMDMNDEDGRKLGTIVLVKDQTLSPVSEYTLKRIENLRRSITKALSRIQQKPAVVHNRESVDLGQDMSDNSLQEKSAKQVKEVVPVQLSVVPKPLNTRERTHRK